jgi:hypothetical protein
MHKRALSGLIVFAMAVGVVVLIGTSRGQAAEGFLFGATPEPIGGSRSAGVDEIESQLGQKLAFVRVFERWESNFPSGFHSEMIAEDRLMVVSVRPVRADGSIVRWREIADATPGSQIHNEMIAWVDNIKGIGVPVWFAFNAEPESSGSLDYGEAEDFIDAWQAFVDLFRSRGATNVSFAWIMTHWSFETDPSERRHVTKWYPGDDYVDLIGSDAYNWDECRDSPHDYWRTLEDTIEPQRQFGLDHSDKPLFLSEVASTERPSNWGTDKASWIDEAADLFKNPGWEQFIAAAWFNVTDPSIPNCAWQMDSSPEALAALKSMANDPYYSGEPTVTPPLPPGEFTDVGADHPFNDDIAWLALQGITKGCNPPTNDRFCPDATVTRAQMAAFLVRALGYTADGGGDLFADDNDSIFEDDIDKLATAGVTMGCNPPTNDRFCPDATVTRAQMAAFLHRAIG